MQRASLDVVHLALGAPVPPQHAPHCHARRLIVIGCCWARLHVGGTRWERGWSCRHHAWLVEIDLDQGPPRRSCNAIVENETQPQKQDFVS